MKKFVKYIVALLMVYLMIFVFVNIAMQKKYSAEDNTYNVDINRTMHQIKEYEKKFGKPVASERDIVGAGNELGESIVSIVSSKEGMDASKAVIELTNQEGDNYKIVATDKACYRIDYVIAAGVPHKFVIMINLMLVLSFVIVMVTLAYIYIKLVLPFNKISELPYELSKGNLTSPLNEQKDKFFGKFIWGLNLLRETLEENKRNELELHREKKTLLMSLSHDIKTPLSAIKLYSTALERDLYKDAEKKKEIAVSIGEKADEIQNYVTEIVTASKEDFLKFEVEISEYYVDDIVQEIKKYYTDKMKLNMIDFLISNYDNNLISCDKERLIEVLQNLIENAIKYGDGKRIALEIKRENSDICFTVVNTGCELPNNELPHIFDSFFRGSNVNQKSGSGLGLYICRELVRLMNGEIYALITENHEMQIEVVIRMA